MLDTFLWLPRREGFVVIDPTHCHTHKIRYEEENDQYFGYTMVFLDPVHSTLSVSLLSFI